MKEDTVKVKFLYEKDSKDVFAYFPEEISDPEGNGTSYANIGQHSECSEEYAAECEDAKYRDYKDLLSELVDIGYTDLDILNRAHTIGRLGISIEEL